jgi:ABC-type polysaccharide/polyol phosphate export permease
VPLKTSAAGAVASHASEMVTELFEFRELLVRMTVRDLTLRYKQSVMGFGWAICMPLLNTALFSVVFMRVAPVQTSVPYPLFAYLGLTVWNLTASALRFSALSLTSNTSLVTKVHFPREIFPLSAVLVAAVDTLVASAVLVALMIYYGIPVSSSLVALPVVVLVQLIFTTAVALLLAMGNLFYRDVKYVFEVVVTVWMFASAVVYPLDNVTGITGAVLRLNPMTHLIEAYRTILFDGRLPDPAAFTATAVASVVLLFGSWLLFHTSEYKFAENI